MSFLNNKKNGVAVFFLICMCSMFTIISINIFSDELKNPEKQQNFISSDAKHYFYGAKEIISGDFAFNYIKKYPHREILYPAVVSIPLYFFGKNIYALGSVNIFFFCFAACCLFLTIKKLYSDSVAALFAAALLLFNKFTFFCVTYQLMTEGLFITCIIAAVYFFISYLRTARHRDLICMAIICGIAQDTRPNGFFLFGSFMLIILLQLFFLKKNADNAEQRTPQGVVPAFFTSCLAFMLCSAPSWGPRVFFFGNPLYHGYLPNFLWADTYAQAHDSGQIFTCYDYLRNHTFGDLPPRIFFGLKKSFFHYPLDYMGVQLWLAMLAGILVAVWQKQKDVLLLAATLFLIMAPVVWTVVSNPTPRIGFAFTLPFSAFFGGYAVAVLRARLRPLRSCAFKPAVQKSPEHS